MSLICEKKVIFYKKILNSVKTKAKEIERILDFRYEDFVECNKGDETCELAAEKMRKRGNFDFSPSLSSEHSKTQMNYFKKYTRKKKQTNSVKLSSNYSKFVQSTSNNSRTIISSFSNTDMKCLSLLTKGSIKDDSVTVRTYDKKLSLPKLKSPQTNQSRISHFYSLTKNVTSYENLQSTSNFSAPKNNTSDLIRNTSIKNQLKLNPDAKRNVKFLSNNNSVERFTSGINQNHINSSKSALDISEKKDDSIYNSIKDKKVFLRKDFGSYFSEEQRKIKPYTNLNIFRNSVFSRQKNAPKTLITFN